MFFLIFAKIDENWKLKLQHFEKNKLYKIVLYKLHEIYKIKSLILDSEQNNEAFNSTTVDTVSFF